MKMDMPGPPYYLHPSDLGLSLCGDGKDILSGYTFLFAAKNNTRSQLWRDGILLRENDGPDAVFKYTGPQGEGLVKFHRHWFHLVLRRAGGRIQAWCDDKPVFDEQDSGRPLNSGKVGLFTVNNGIMVARAKVWYQDPAPRVAFPDLARDRAVAAEGAGSTTVDPFANDFEHGIGAFRPDDPHVPVLLERSEKKVHGGRLALKITNQLTGGTFGVRALDKSFTPAERPHLRFAACIPPLVHVNLYLLAKAQWYVAPMTGGTAVDDDQKLLGPVAGMAADDLWHEADVDLAAAFKQVGLPPETTIERVVFGMKEPDPYAHTGFLFNRYGATWYLDDWSVGK
jgi:hypothetical protein